MTGGPSAHFWPILFPGGEAAAKFIRVTIVLTGSGQVLLPGRQGSPDNSQHHVNHDDCANYTILPKTCFVQ